MFYIPLIPLITTFTLPTSARIVLGYYTAESVYAGYKIDDLPVAYLTHVAYAFGALMPDGTVVFEDTQAAIGNATTSANSTLCKTKISGNLASLWALKQANPHLRTLFSIGGWNATATQMFSLIAGDTTLRKRFSKSAVSMMLDYGFDGLDVDWEYPRTPEENENYVALLREVRNEMNAIQDGKKYVLTIASPPQQSLIRNMKVMELAMILDWFNCMTYDYSRDELNVVVADQPLENGNGGNSVKSTIDTYLSMGAENDQLVLGIPLYGYKYSGIQDGSKLGVPASQSTAIPIKDIYALEESQWRASKDSETSTSFIYNPMTMELITFVEITKQLAQRVKFIRDYNLAGAMFWTMRFDMKPDERSIAATVSSLLGKPKGDKMPKFPVCAPRSSICNIQKECPASMDFRGADDTSSAVSKFFHPALVFAMYRSFFLIFW